MKIYTILTLLLIGLLGFSCTSENPESIPEDKPKLVGPINPNGDSELALLMRAMFDDGMRMKAQIKKGEKPKAQIDFEKIFTAEATEPDKVATEEFHAFATSYVESMKALENAEPEEADGIYRGMVESCMNCHKAFCPGPTMRIKKMY